MPPKIRHAQPDQRASSVKAEYIHPTGMPARHKGLVELIRGGIDQGQEQRKPPETLAKTQSIPIGQSQTSITEHVPAFFDEQIGWTEIWHFITRHG